MLIWSSILLAVLAFIIWWIFFYPRLSALYIIGNGFDRHHGYPSSYGNFRDYVKSKDTKLYDALAENFCDYEALWNDFEEALADLDIDAITDDASAFLQSYSAEDWSDASHHDYQYEISLRIDLVTKHLRKHFTDWILTLCKPMPSALARKMILDKTAAFISFNYTPTLEYVYDIPRKDIFYIHGRAEGIDSVLIIGHSHVPEQRNKPYDENADVRVIEGERMFDDYFLDTYKTTGTIIKENRCRFRRLRSVKRIYVLGHSMSRVDLPYFCEIIKNIDHEKTRWIISYHESKEVEPKRKIIIDLGINTALVEFKRMEEIDSPQLSFL